MSTTRNLFMACAAVLTVAGAAKADDEHVLHHVLLLSLDGLHQRGLAAWFKQNPNSTLARLSQRGITYTNARTTTPSDSFPGMLAQLTGGTPKTTGGYYDASYDRNLFSPHGAALAACPHI